jgi:signal transduction histidine kinase
MKPGFGLRNLRERVELQAGSLTIESKTSGVYARIDLPGGGA